MQRIVTFLKESWAELKKVVWPTRRQTVRLTLAVLLITFGVAGFTAVLDYFLNQMLNLLVER